jgi:hypothetical protein
LAIARRVSSLSEVGWLTQIEILLPLSKGLRQIDT